MTKPAVPPVSDHAVLRYLQRQHNVPVEEIRSQLAASAAIGIAHDAAIIRLGRVKILVLDGKVVTCLPRKHRSKIRRPHRQDEFGDD